MATSTCPPRHLARPSKSRIMRLAWAGLRDLAFNCGMTVGSALKAGYMSTQLKVAWRAECNAVDRRNASQRRVWDEIELIKAEMRAAGPSPVFLPSFTR